MARPRREKAAPPPKAKASKAKPSRGSRSWLRWLLVLAALGGAGYLGSTLKIGGRTPFAHAYAWVKTTHAVRSATAWVNEHYDRWFASKPEPVKPAKEKKAHEERPKNRHTLTEAELEETATPKRVALLDRAAAEAFGDEREATPTEARGGREPSGAEARGAARASRRAAEASTREGEEASARSAEPERPARATPKAPAKRTKVDERLSADDKKALDQLVTSRVAPRR